MGDRRWLELAGQDRAHADGRWQEDIAWLERSAEVPARQKAPAAGLKGKFEGNPLLWMGIVLLIGGLSYAAVVWILF
ncbi:MAG: hypothetical protein AB1449_05875 [Chloroflexota bacterium]